MRNILILIVCVVSAYVAFAALSIRSIVADIQAADAVRLSDSIDFPAVRASLKEQLTGIIVANAAKNIAKAGNKGDAIGAGLIATIGPAIVNNMIDGLISPSGVATLLTTQNGAAKPSSKKPYGILNVYRRLTVVSPTRLRLAIERGSITLQLVDWTWKITDIRVPPDILNERSKSIGSLTAHHIATTTSVRISGDDDLSYRAEIQMAATDLERMFQATLSERIGVDLSAPGTLEEEIGKFIEQRVTMRDATGNTCNGRVEKSGEDPGNSQNALIVIRFDCARTDGHIFYDATKLLATQGHGAQQTVVVAGERPDEIILDRMRPIASVNR